ncbi:MAG: SurA N-terminal domain-containing protein [Deltaproteobacteria bacterium]|jgi:peptidyl-prolyl cis-trans isomerase D|nr:SurA N-terminal domain-containing protein [Deltaproteobacteria bacterium]
MLKYIRQRSGGTISVLIIGAIAIVFIFWGVGGQDTSNQTSITMDDQRVSLATFRDTQRRVLDQLRQTNPGDIRQLETVSYRQTLATLLERHNLLKLADSFNLRVSDAEVNKIIKSDPLFLDESGRFNLDLYRDTVTKRFGQSLASYENFIRENILLEQMSNLVRGLSHIPKSQIVEEFHFSNDRITLNYAQFKTASYMIGLNPPDTELAAYFAANQEKYRIPEEIKLTYVEVPASAFLDEVTASPEEILDAYNSSLSELTTPEKAEVSHILIQYPDPQNVTPKDEAATLVKAQEILEMAKTEDFATLAGEVSQDATTASLGGDLKEVIRGQTLGAFDEAIFGAGIQNLNKPIGPVKTPLGYHILLVRSHTPVSTQTLEEAKEEIEKSVKLRKARNLAAEKIESLETVARYPANLTDAAKTMGLTTETTEFFNLESPPPLLADKPEETQRAFKLDPGQISFPLSGDNSYALYAVAEKKPSYLPTLEDEATKSKALSDLITQIAERSALADARAFLKKAQEEGWAAAVASLPEIKPEIGQSPAFKRLSLFDAGTPLILTDVSTFLRNYVTLAAPGQVAPEPIPVLNPLPQGFIAISLEAIAPADESEIDSPGGFSAANAEERLRETLYSFWLYKANQEVNLIIPPELKTLIEGGQS